MLKPIGGKYAAKLYIDEKTKQGVNIGGARSYTLKLNKPVGWRLVSSTASTRVVQLSQEFALNRKLKTLSMAASVPDSSATTWPLPWASNFVGAELLSATQVRSNEANQVFRLCFDNGDYVLKIGPDLNREYQRLLWLDGRLSAPRPLGIKSQGSVDALLMSAVEGADLANLSASLPAQCVIARLGAALKTVHAVSVSDWPFGGSGTTLVHGDACLPNFLFVSDRLSGYIDVGEMALGDPEIDLAAAVWSLQYNLGAGYGLAFLREYGLSDADEELVERLRLRYEMDSC